MSTRPTPLSRVRVSARGCLESGEVVDKQKTFVFTVGDGDVIQGTARIHVASFPGHVVSKITLGPGRAW